MESTVFAGAATAGSSGLFRWKPGQSEWERLKNGLPDRVRVYSILMEKGDPNALLIGTQFGVFRSADDGESWLDLGVPAEERPILSLLVDPKDAATIYAGSDYTAIFKTEDAGATWRRLPTVQPEGAITGCFPVRVLKMAIDPNNTDEVYAALEVGGVIRSLDGGEQWEDISKGLLELSEEPHLRNCILSDDLTEGMMDLHALSVSAEQPGTIWAANRMGLFVSNDRGDNWREFGIKRFSNLTYGRDLLVSPHDPNVFIAGLSESSRGSAGSVYRSGDTGETWQRLDHDISIDSTVMTVAVSGNDPDRIYCAARLGQVFGTEDGGATWNAFPLPMGVEDVRAIACF
jgi:photosystem II stability/assembly factor-like uncharacterized protein